MGWGVLVPLFGGKALSTVEFMIGLTYDVSKVSWI